MELKTRGPCCSIVSIIFLNGRVAAFDFQLKIKKKKKGE
jgi:hypothetical protein